MSGDGIRFLVISHIHRDMDFTDCGGKSSRHCTYKVKNILFVVDSMYNRA